MRLLAFAGTNRSFLAYLRLLAGHAKNSQKIA